MRNTLILAAVAALAFTSIADAKTAPAKGMTTQPTRCHNGRGHVIKCPAVAAAMAKTAPATPAKKAMAPAATKVASTGKAPHCVKGKACGNDCIKMTDVCHK